jgi:hypothetical protein
VNSTDYSRPSGYARWGWGWAAFAFFGGLPNIILTVSDPNAWRIALCLFTLACTVICLTIWWRGVGDDREHRAFMRAHEQHMAARDRWYLQ